MSYQALYKSCYTSKGREAANALRYMHGFKTEAQHDDIDRVQELDIREMGGAE